MTVGCATVVFFLVADFPEEAKWLSDDQRAFVKARLAEDMGDSQLNAKTTWRDVLSVFKDFKIILGALIYFGIVVPGYGIAYFAPAILRSFGFSPVKTQLYSVPPSFASFLLGMIFAVASDYYKRRYIFILPSMFTTVVGMVVLLAVRDNVNVRYGAVFLISAGMCVASSIIMCWVSTNRESRSIPSTDLIAVI